MFKSLPLHHSNSELEIGNWSTHHVTRVHFRCATERRADDAWDLKGTGGNRPAPSVSTRANVVTLRRRGGVRVVSLERFEWTLPLQQQHLLLLYLLLVCSIRERRR